MAKVKRKPGKTSIDKLVKKLAKDKVTSKVGWFEGAKYEDGTPVAYVASIQEFGKTFTHPGGTSYVIRDGKAQFVKSSFTGPVHGITGPHQIVIPPRPFMRTTISERRDVWKKQAKSGAKAIIAGNSTIFNVIDAIGQGAEGDIRKKISTIQEPPLKSGTIRARQRKLADGKKVGNLTKPLVESALLVNSLTSITEQK